MEKQKIKVYFDNVKRAFDEVCQELLDSQFYATGCSEDDCAKKVAVIIGMTGENTGRILLETSEETTRRITEIMNYGPFVNKTEMYLYMGEFVNIIAGRAITYINNQFKGSQIRLTPPALFSAKDLDIMTPNIQSLIMFYTGDLGTIKLDIGFEGV